MTSVVCLDGPCRDLIGEDSQLPIDQLYDYFEYGAIEADLPVQVCRVMEQYLPPGACLPAPHVRD